MTDVTCSVVSRRQFIKGLGATVTVAVVGGYSIATFARSDTAKTLAAPVIPAETYPLLDGRTLVIVANHGIDDPNVAPVSDLPVPLPLQNLCHAVLPVRVFR